MRFLCGCSGVWARIGNERSDAVYLGVCYIRVHLLCEILGNILVALNARAVSKCVSRRRSRGSLTTKRGLISIPTTSMNLVDSSFLPPAIQVGLISRIMITYYLPPLPQRSAAACILLSSSHSFIHSSLLNGEHELSLHSSLCNIVIT